MLQQFIAEPTRFTGGTGNILDLIISDSTMARYIQRFGVLLSVGSSDHLTIFAEIYIVCPNKQSLCIKFGIITRVILMG